MRKDQVFADQLAQVGDFKFDPKVAKVFDDMVNRSTAKFSAWWRN